MTGQEESQSRGRGHGGQTFIPRWQTEVLGPTQLEAELGREPKSSGQLNLLSSSNGLPVGLQEAKTSGQIFVVAFWGFL